jgi:hypothetical protein
LAIFGCSQNPRFLHLSKDIDMIRCILGSILLACAGQACASTLTTPSFIVRITVNCAEGNVTCDKVTYVGTSRKTGKRMKLRGKTMHSTCADGITPCQFQGYGFDNGATSYSVMEGGRLLVMRGKKVLLDEKGSWDW